MKKSQNLIAEAGVAKQHDSENFEDFEHPSFKCVKNKSEALVASDLF